MFQEVLTFWFKEIQPKQWWIADPVFDGLVKERYLGLLQQAAAGELHEWRVRPHGRLAEIIVLDQFARNVHRGTPQAFAQDAMALVLSQEVVAAGALAVLGSDERNFLLMPFMHSESRVVHVQAEALFKEYAPARGTFRRGVPQGSLLETDKSGRPACRSLSARQWRYHANRHEHSHRHDRQRDCRLFSRHAGASSAPQGLRTRIAYSLSSFEAGQNRLHS